MLVYNGEVLERKVKFKSFRKFALQHNFKFESWEQGEWIEVTGVVTKETFESLLR